MALHTELPIYRKGAELLGLAFDVQEQLPRGQKRFLGERIVQHCVDMLDLMAMANATRREARAAHINDLLVRQRAVEVLMRVGHDKRWVSPRLWGESMRLLGAIGSQAGGWLKSANKAPAA